MAFHTISGIYEIVNTVTGRRYVGSSCHISRRWRKHRNFLLAGNHHSKYLQRSWNMHGPDAFEWRVIELCHPDELIPREQAAVAHLRPEYNVSPVAGTQRGYRHTPEAIAKMSAAQVNKKPMTGFKHSAEARANMSAAHKGNKPTEATRLKMSAALRGRKMSAEAKAKMSAWHKGRKFSESHKTNLRAAKRLAWQKRRAAANSNASQPSLFDPRN